MGEIYQADGSASDSLDGEISVLFWIHGVTRSNILSFWLEFLEIRCLGIGPIPRFGIHRRNLDFDGGVSFGVASDRRVLSTMTIARNI